MEEEEEEEEEEEAEAEEEEEEEEVTRMAGLDLLEPSHGVRRFK